MRRERTTKSVTRDPSLESDMANESHASQATHVHTPAHTTFNLSNRQSLMKIIKSGQALCLCSALFCSDDVLLSAGVALSLPVPSGEGGQAHGTVGWDHVARRVAREQALERGLRPLEGPCTCVWRDHLPRLSTHFIHSTHSFIPHCIHLCGKLRARRGDGEQVVVRGGRCGHEECVQIMLRVCLYQPPM